MGKGDQRTRRGKIYRGTFGKRRPKKRRQNVKAAAEDQASRKTEKEPKD
jgi:30S ribosomal protein S31